jgi:bifunctional non-homologous end joining protein LigD
MPNKRHIEVEGRELTISNLEKVYFPSSGFTKGQLISFYSEIAEVIVPHLRDRPLTLKRYPDGINGEHFYEKNAPSHTPTWVKRFAVPRSEGGSTIHYVLCNDRATLVWATNLADIEKHALLAVAPNLNRPTSLVFDLDPGESTGILDCGHVALHLKDLFDALNLQSFVKVSGSKGLHLTVPLNSDVSYEMTQPFAKALAELASQQMPDRVVSEMAKVRRRGKVFIDWSQNSDFKTTVCVYSMRAKREEPFVSMPVTWKELARAVDRGDEKSLFFTPDAALKRIKRVGDLFDAVLTLEQMLPSAFTQALSAGPPQKLSSWPRNRRDPGDKSLREYAAKRDHARRPEPAVLPAAKDAKLKGLSGRSPSEIAEANDAQWQSNGVATPTKRNTPGPKHKHVEAAFIEPMRCRAVTALPEDGRWKFEIKFDGYRCIAVKRGSEVILFSRNKNVLNDRFPNVVDALRLMDGEFVLDGEIVALDEQGRPSFQLLQNSRTRPLSAYFYLFDLLIRDGEALHTQTIERRRERLSELFPESIDPIRLSPLLEAPINQVLEGVRKLRLEGVIGKRNGSKYEPGERSGAWIKHRTDREQEFVIGGYVPGAHGFDALLVGIYENERFIFVAKVKNGFVSLRKAEIFSIVKKFDTPKCPFTNLPEKKASRWGESLTAEKMKECRWVEPKLVCQVAFVEWTDAGHLRHCTFIALWDDKNPAVVTREV